MAMQQYGRNGLLGHRVTCPLCGSTERQQVWPSGGETANDKVCANVRLSYLAVAGYLIGQIQGVFVQTRRHARFFLQVLDV